MIGSIFSAVPSLISGAIGLATSAEQRKRAEQLTKEAKSLKKREIRPEFLQALRSADMMATQGSPLTKAALQQSESATANNLKAIQQSSPSGALAAAAISAQLGRQQAEAQNILAQDAAQRQRGQLYANQTLQGVGQQQEQLEQEKIRRQEALIGRAAALEDNALKRREASIGGMLKGVTGAITSFGGALGNAASNAIASNIETSAEKDAENLESLDEGMMNAQENMERVDPSDPNYDSYMASITDMEEQKKLYKDKMRKKQLNQFLLQSLFK